MKKGIKIAGRLLKSVAFGVADNVPVINSIKANIQSELGGSGKFDYVRLATAVTTLGVVIALIFGYLSMEQVEKLLKLI